MKTTELLNYARDQWVAGSGQRSAIPSAIDGTIVATTGSGGIDFAAMLTHARTVGGPALRALTFHQRARLVKGLGLAIMARKEELYELSFATGATRNLGMRMVHREGRRFGGALHDDSSLGLGLARPI